MSRGLALGLGLGSLPAVAFALWVLVQNPWFLDRPGLYLGLGALLPGLVLGLILHLAMRAPAGKLRLLPLLPLHLAALAFLWPEPAVDPVDVLVVGVDGATFEQIDPLVAQGQLPAFEAMLDSGGHAVLRSMEPMFSPLLWTTMAAGKPPEDHGVHGFHVHSTDCKLPRFWDVAEQEDGRSVGIYKWLVTWPPRQVDGFIVPAWLAPSPETTPPELSFVKELELANRLKRKKVVQTRSTVELVMEGIPQGLRVSTLWEAGLWTLRERGGGISDDERFLNLQLLRGKIDRDVFVHALHTYQPEIATFTYYATDGLAHRFWRYHEPEAFTDVDYAQIDQYGGAITQAYTQADAILGELMERVSPETQIVVLSDHGFQPLKEEGGRQFFTPLSEALRVRLMKAGLAVQVSRLGVKLTVALDDETTPMEELEATLSAIIDDTGQPFYRWEPVPDAPRTLGLTIRDESFDEARVASGTVAGDPMKAYVKLTEPFSGDHKSNGIWIVRSPDIAPGTEMDEVALLDVSPTLQAMSGVKPAQDLPGRVVVGEDVRGPESRDHLAAGLYGEASEGDVNTEQLRALGYIE